MPSRPSASRRPRRPRASPGRRLAALLALAAIAAASFGWPPQRVEAAEGRTLHVPADYPRLEDAIAASAAGDVILLAAGTYPGEIRVPLEKSGITIRGEDRNTVVFDGSDVRHNAIEVEADRVTLENMTAHNYLENGFYWDGVDGYAGRYLTVWNVGLYGIYAIQSRGGLIEQSYVSAAADAAFYIGECQPCNATVRNVTATLSAVGYSGTNAGGNLVVEDSRFSANSVGILPNSFDVGLEPPPQRGATFRRNTVVGSGSVVTPRATPLGGYYGIGIGIAGGSGNVIEDNVVENSIRYGIAVFTAIDRQAAWVPSDNWIARNRVAGSGIADLALADGSGAGNCFEGNDAPITLPINVTLSCSVAGGGDDLVANDLVVAPPSLLEGLPEAPSYADIPAPGPQPTMPANSGLIGGQPTVVWAAVAAAAVAAVALALGLLLRRRRSAPA